MLIASSASKNVLIENSNLLCLSSLTLNMERSMFEHCLVWTNTWNVFFMKTLTCFIMWLHCFSMAYGIVTDILYNFINSVYYGTYIVNLNMQTSIVLHLCNILLYYVSCRDMQLHIQVCYCMVLHVYIVPFLCMCNCCCACEFQYSLEL